MITPRPSPWGPSSGARQLNEIMVSLYAERGVPDSVSFCVERQAVIALFADGGAFVQPFDLNKSGQFERLLDE